MSEMSGQIFIVLATILSAQACFCCHDEFRLFHEEKYVNLSTFTYGHSNIIMNIVWDELLEQENRLEVVVSEGSQVYREAQNKTEGNYTIELNSTEDVQTNRILNFSLPQLNISSELHLACNESCCNVCSSMVVEVSNVTKLGENDYLLSVSTNTSSRLKVMAITYNNPTSGLNFANGTVDEKGIQFTMDKLHVGGCYEITVAYYDVDNVDCQNSTAITLEVPIRFEPITHIKVMIVVPLVMLIGVTIFTMKYAGRITAVILKLTERNCNLNLNDDIFLDVSPLSSNAKQVDNVLYKPVVPPRQEPHDSYDFPREKIEHVRILGQGEFGIVYESKAWGLHGRRGYTMVAVKVLKESIPESEIAEFKHEIDLQKKIGNHRNVIRMLGCVELSQPTMIIMELVPTGNLKQYFRKLRNMWSGQDRKKFFGETSDGEYIQPECEQQYIQSPRENLQNITDSLDNLIHCESANSTPLCDKKPEPALDHKELENFAYQIACGMAHLENKGIVHRDLAARNILITYSKILKVSDFGMSRQGTYVSYRMKKIPLRWKALEFLEQFKDDSKSDVWAYGVVLWEIGTLGAFPYEEIHNENILPYLQAGYRLPKPITCTDHHYKVMLSCWKREPCSRPSFAELKKHFGSGKYHAYLDFRGINPNYLFPPMCDEKGDGMDDIRDITGSSFGILSFGKIKGLFRVPREHIQMECILKLREALVFIICEDFNTKVYQFNNDVLL